MGQSTDGILAFGVDLGEEGDVALPWLDDEDEDFEEWYCKQSGHDPGMPWAEKVALLKSAPIEVVRHCSGDYPMFIIAVEGTPLTAHRGTPLKIPNLGVPAKLEQAVEFCAKHGIPFEDPAWLLASMWW